MCVFQAFFQKVGSRHPIVSLACELLVITKLRTVQDRDNKRLKNIKFSVFSTSYSDVAVIFSRFDLHSSTSENN